MHPLFVARSRGYLLDCLTYVTVPAALIPVGLLVRRGRRPDPRLIMVLSAIPPVSATLLAAVQESRSGTLGHRAVGLSVVGADGRAPSLGRAVLRNVVKIGAPWQLGHVVAIGASRGAFERREPATILTTVALYAWLAAAVVTAASRSGRALHDRLAGTRVSR